MLDLGSWSFGRVVLASLLWWTLDIVLLAAYVYFKFRSQWHSTGSGGIGAVAGVISVIVALAVLLGPPIVLTVVWWVLRRRP